MRVALNKYFIINIIIMMVCGVCDRTVTVHGCFNDVTSMMVCDVCDEVVEEYLVIIARQFTKRCDLRAEVHHLALLL